MAPRFRPYHPDQGLLLPPDLRDWLPAGYLAHHVSDLVDGLDLTAFYAPYEGDGRRPWAEARTEAQSEGRSAVPARVRGAGREGAGQFHGSAKPDHEDLRRRFSAMLQGAVGGGGGEPVDCGGGGGVERQRPGSVDAAGGGGGIHSWEAPGDGVGGCRVLQRGGARQVGDARGGRLRGLGPGRPARGRGGRGEASGEGAHGQKAGDRGGAGAVRRAQVAVGGADRMDQGGAGFPAFQRAGPEQGPGRMGPGVSGVERQADARA